MAKLNVAPKPQTNHEGTRVTALNPEATLRRSVMSHLLWEKEFYEDGQEIAERIKALIQKVPAEKVAEIAIEAREKMHLRHVPLFIVREMARLPSHRQVVAKTLERVIQRADELAEFMAIYWADGKDQPLSAQVKLGLAAAFKKFNAYQLAKYDRPGIVKLRDVLFLCHAKPADAASRWTRAERKATQARELSDQERVWRQLVDGTLPTPDTWEATSGKRKLTKEDWLRLLSENKLGALAILRNLRNMQEAGVPDAGLRAGLNLMRVDRVLPFRFIAAARFAPHLEPELEKAMYRCLADAPKLPGRTAIVVDTSPSMWQAKISAKSDMDRFDAAAALAILVREVTEEVRVYAFNNKAYEVPARRGFALRDALKQTQGNYSCGGLAVEMANKKGYDRIIVLTDGQWHYKSASGMQNPDSEGGSTTVSPPPLTERAYMVNMQSARNGVGYGRWTSLDGWSEAILDYVRASETSDLP